MYEEPEQTKMQHCPKCPHPLPLSSLGCVFVINCAKDGVTFPIMSNPHPHPTPSPHAITPCWACWPARLLFRDLTVYLIVVCNVCCLYLQMWSILFWLGTIKVLKHLSFHLWFSVNVPMWMLISEQANGDFGMIIIFNQCFQLHHLCSTYCSVQINGSSATHAKQLSLIL